MASPHDPSLNADQSQARSHFEKKKSLIHQHLLLSSFSSYFLSYHQKVHRASSLLHQMLPSPPRLHVCAWEQGYCLLPGLAFVVVSLFLCTHTCVSLYFFLRTGLLSFARFCLCFCLFVFVFVSLYVCLCIFAWEQGYCLLLGFFPFLSLFVFVFVSLYFSLCLCICAWEQGYCLLQGFVFAFVSLYVCLCIFAWEQGHCLLLGFFLFS